MASSTSRKFLVAAVAITIVATLGISVRAALDPLTPEVRAAVRAFERHNDIVPLIMLGGRATSAVPYLAEYVGFEFDLQDKPTESKRTAAIIALGYIGGEEAVQAIVRDFEFGIWGPEYGFHIESLMRAGGRTADVYLMANGIHGADCEAFISMLVPYDYPDSLSVYLDAINLDQERWRFGIYWSLVGLAGSRGYRLPSEFANNVELAESIAEGYPTQSVGKIALALQYFNAPVAEQALLDMRDADPERVDRNLELREERMRAEAAGTFEPRIRPDDSERDEAGVAELLTRWESPENCDHKLALDLLFSGAPAAIRTVGLDLDWIEELKERERAGDTNGMYMESIRRNFLIFNEERDPAYIPILIELMPLAFINGNADSPDGFFCSYSSRHPYVWTFDMLHYMTGENFGLDPDAWRTWWETEGRERFGLNNN